MTDQLEFRFHVDGSDGKPVLEQTHKVDLKMPAAEFQLQQQGDVILEYVQSAELKSGVYNVAISVMENQNSSTMGVQKFSITLPSDSEKCLQVGPLMLASAVAPGTEQVAAPKVNDKGQILYGTNIYSMQSRRMFPATGTLNGFYEIYSASVPSVFISFKLYADGKVMSQTSEREIAAYTKPEEQIISNFFSVPYKNLAAGKYELEITARQNKTDCAQSSKSAFEVIQQPGT